MAAIDVGPGAINGDNSGGASTHIALGNPANASGTLTVFEIWAYLDLGSVKIGTFYGSETSWTNRDYETIGSVASGLKQTFSGLNCDVQTGDCIGVYFATGRIEANSTGSGGRSIKDGDQFDAGTVSDYTVQSNTLPPSLYGTGVTAGWTGKINGVTNPAKINGIAVANIAKVNGI